MYVPFLIFGLCAALSFICLFFLPPTLGKPIPQTVEEVVESDRYQEFANERDIKEVSSVVFFLYPSNC